MSLPATIQCSFDRNLRQQLSERPGIQEQLGATLSSDELKHFHRNLLKQGIRLTPRTAPFLYTILDRIDALLQPGVDYELFATPSYELNASCLLTPDGKRGFIILGSATIERLDEPELAFILGHEIGHLCYQHGHFPAMWLVREHSHQLSPVDTCQLLAWSRYAEMSADRIGLLCCETIDSTCKTFFRLSSGVTSTRLGFVPEEYLAQLDLIHHLSDIEGANAEDWFQTHPFNPLRIRALQLFCHSLAYRSRLGANDGWTLEQVDQEIGRLARMMDPALVRMGDETLHGEVHEFMTLTAIALTMVDGDVKEQELLALKDLVGLEAMEANYRRFQTAGGEMAEEPFERIQDLAQRLQLLTSPVERYALIRHLLVVIAADGALSPAEAHLFDKIATLLEFPPELIQTLLDSLFDDPGAAV